LARKGPGLNALTQAAIARKRAKLTAKNAIVKNDAKEKDNDDQDESKKDEAAAAATMEE
jgi:hypothetical protein